MRNVDRSLPVALFIGVVIIASHASAYSTGISTTLFPNPPQGCNFCHNDASAPTPTVTLTGPTAVAPNSADNEYTLQIAVMGAQTHGGLNVAATGGVLGTGGSASTNTKLINGTGGLSEITHTLPKSASGGLVNFTFLWDAPSAPGNVTLKAWGNAVNFDGNPATGDKAAPFTLTVNVGAPTPTPACDPTPLPDCRKPIQSGKSTFVVKDNALDNKDTLTWNWTKGAATSLADFGDPVNGSTTYHLCVYDESAGVPTAVMAMTVPPGGTCAGKPCWVVKKTGFLYKDKNLTNDGFMQLQLTVGAAGKAKIVAKGKGELLPVPAPVGPGLLAQDTAVIVQLVSSDGICWDADFSTAKKNDTKQFNAKSD